ncbi:hypothetical protein HGRIS_007199 [Hohenbuehelia grisea]|uniref:Protein kinase domain-containing protein n=1 Tax=Hohenbuehelia grisea TaxID=104357 RepID=A0ABR3JC32_9AGAR
MPSSPSSDKPKLSTSSIAAAKLVHGPTSPTSGGSSSSGPSSSSSSTPRISSPLTGKTSVGVRPPNSGLNHSDSSIKRASPLYSPAVSAQTLTGNAPTSAKLVSRGSPESTPQGTVLADSPQSIPVSLPDTTQSLARNRPRGQSTSTIRADDHLHLGEPRENSLPNRASPAPTLSNVASSFLPPNVSSSSIGVGHGRSVAMMPTMEPPHSKPHTTHGRSKSRSRSRSRDSSKIDLPGVGSIDLRTGVGLEAFSAPTRHRVSTSEVSHEEQAALGVELLSAERQEVAMLGDRTYKHRSMTSASAGFQSGQGFGSGIPGGSATVTVTASASRRAVKETQKLGALETSTGRRRTLGGASDPEEEQLDGWFSARGHVARAVRAALGPGSNVHHEVLDDLALITGEDSTPHTSQVRVPARLPASASTSGRDILDLAANAAHDILELGTDFLDFAPIPGLQSAARTLLAVWDALEGVDLNRLACLRLVQRCADTLYSVRQEIHEAGDEVTVELRKPIDQLDQAFQDILDLMLKIADMSFLKRYLKRDDIARQLSGSHDAITSAVAMFNLQVQIRCLKYAQATFKNTRQLLDQMGQTQSPETTPVPGSQRPLPRVQEVQKQHVMPPADIPTIVQPGDVVEQLREVHGRKNWDDRRVDEEGRRRILADAMRPGNDALIVQKLQLDPTQWPEAIKALQRELEREIEKNGMASSFLPGQAQPTKSQPDAGNGLGLEVGPETEAPVQMPVGQPAIAPPLTMDPTGDVILEDVEDTRPGVPEVVSGTNLARAGTTSTVDSTESGYESTTHGKDTLDREFLESVIDALRRMSRGSETVLPPWTITNFEIDKEKQIGTGFFATVFKGSWRRRIVAIKELVPSAPRNLFVHEVEIWQSLHHPNLLELYGASSTTADPPWFFISPYMKHGDLSHFLSRLQVDITASNGFATTSSAVQGPVVPMMGARRGSSRSPTRGAAGGGAGIGGWRMLSTPPQGVPAEVLDEKRLQKSTDLLRFMHEIAKGMEYLHSRSVLHGDLKGVNVLVNDRLHCVITDFGQSELKSEAYRISGMVNPHGTFRWQAPELLRGSSDLTTEMDIYSFAITCVEILNWGKVPFSLMDDDSYRHLVLKENGRPTVPASRFVTPPFMELLNAAWNVDPFKRPSFSKIVQTLRQIRKTPGIEIEEVASPPALDQSELEGFTRRVSPDMHPIPLPGRGVLDALGLSPASSDAGSYRTAREFSNSPPKTDTLYLTRSEESVHEPISMPEPVIFNPNTPARSRASSLFTSSPSNESEDDHLKLLDFDGYESPVPLDERLAEIRNERRYRMLLNHDYHPSLTLPLWSPSPIPVGSVGYLLKPNGSFVTLFNAFNPLKSAGVNLPSLHGYGLVSVGKQRQDKRSAAQRGLDVVAGLFKSSHSTSISRKYSFPLRAGHKGAFICAESTLYHYMEALDTPKKWFKANIGAIIEQFGSLHEVQKEDIFLTIGTLSAPDYALFVSHSHPDGQAHFNIYSSQREGQPWGTFTTDTEVSPGLAGPSYHEELGDIQCASKVSVSGGAWDTVLIAKLRFKPDVLEPTSL